MIDTKLLNQLYKDDMEKLSKILLGRPTPVRPIVTQTDAEKTFIYRYFVRSANDTDFVVEVDKNQYQEFKKNPRFIALEIKWKIVGKKENEQLRTGIIVYGVTDINRQTVLNADLTFGGLKKYIQDYAEFWVAEKI